jgi:hypothetical protein
MAVLLPQEPKAQKLGSVMLGGLSRKSGHFNVVVLVVVVFIVLYVITVLVRLVGFVFGSKYMREGRI